MMWSPLEMLLQKMLLLKKLELCSFQVAPSEVLLLTLACQDWLVIEKYPLRWKYWLPVHLQHAQTVLIMPYFTMHALPYLSG
jgi:hypothetical protein